MPNIPDLATNSALTAVEHKIPDVSSLVTKADYNTKISEIEKKVSDYNHDKYITNPEFNNLAAGVFNARLTQANLVAKTDFDTKLQSFSKRVTSNKTKLLLVENELKKLKTFGLSNFKGKGHFEEDGTQNHLVFQPIYRYFKKIAGVGSSNYIYFCKSKGLSDERINSISTSNYSITPKLSYYGTKARVKFSGRCLKQDKATYNHGPIVNIYIIYEISKNYNICSYPTLEHCLFGAVSLTKILILISTNILDTVLDLIKKGEFSFGNEFGRNVIIFAADMSSSIHINNITENILVPGKDFIQGLGNTKIYAEKCIQSILLKIIISYLFGTGTEIHKFKAKDFEIVVTPLCLGNISKDFSVDNMKKKQD